MAHPPKALGQRQGTDLALWPVLAPLLVGLAAFALFCIGLDHGPEFDELYHVLAARGWLETGEPRIGDGVYERTILFTILVAQLFALFGESLIVARLPSVLASAILAALFFAWLRRTSGEEAAWIGTLLFVLSPLTIDFAQFTRFYALQSLTFFIGATAVFRSVTEPDPPLRKAGLLLGAALAFATACYLQITTLIGLAGLVLWWGLVVLLPWLQRQPPARRGLLLLATTVVALAVVALAVTSGTVAQILDMYQRVPLFAAQAASEVWYYHFWLILYYPTLWSIFPFMALVALAVRPRPALLALCIFGTAFLLHSFAASKATRYIAYALPFLYVVFAIALPELWGRLRQATRAALARLALPDASWPVAAPWLERGVLALILLFAIGANAAFVRSAFMLADIRVPPQPPRVNWEAAHQALAPRLASTDVLLTTTELDALYFLGRHDVLLSRSRLSEIRGADFARDSRTGRPVVGTLEAVAKIMDCSETGLIVSTSHHWRDAVLDARTAEFIVRSTQRLDLPASWNVHAYAWEHPAATPVPGDCPSLSDGAAGVPLPG